MLLGLGLVPALALSWVYEITPEGVKRDAGTGSSAAHASRTGHKLNWATLVVAGLAIALLIADRMTPSPPASSPLEDQVEQSKSDSAAGVRDASIAVLPFSDLSPGRDQEYFSDGMAEEILNALVKVEGLQVASRTSSFAFKGQESLGMRQIAA